MSAAVHETRGRGWLDGAPRVCHATLAGPRGASLEIPIGALDDAGGLSLETEIFIDHIPDSDAHDGTHPRLTRKEAPALFGISEKEDLA
ncbi:MAG: hypothetical protein Kow0013_20700 [Pararhodobacter sp.]